MSNYTTPQPVHINIATRVGAGGFDWKYCSPAEYRMPGPFLRMLTWQLDWLS
jgi:hypothetical protein